MKLSGRMQDAQRLKPNKETVRAHRQMRKISAWRIDHMMGKDYLHRGLWDARRSRDTCLVVKIPRRRSRRDMQRRNTGPTGSPAARRAPLKSDCPDKDDSDVLSIDLKSRPGKGPCA